MSSHNISQTVEQVALKSKVRFGEIVMETNDAVSSRWHFRETCDKQKLFASSDKANSTHPNWDYGMVAELLVVPSKNLTRF